MAQESFDNQYTSVNVQKLPYYTSPAPSFSFSSSTTASTSPSPTGYAFTQATMQSPNPQIVGEDSQGAIVQDQQNWKTQPVPMMATSSSASMQEPQARGYGGYESQGMVQQASMPGAIYSELPTYRFPHMPSPVQTGPASPTFQQHFQQQQQKSSSGRSRPSRLVLDQSAYEHRPTASWDGASSAGYSTPMMSPALSQHATSPSTFAPEASTSSQYRLQPPLPIVAMQETSSTATSHYSDYHAAEEDSPSGLVADSEQYDAVQSQEFDRQMTMQLSQQQQRQSPHRLGGNQIISPNKPSGNGFLGIQYPGHPPFAAQSSSNEAGYHYATSSTTHHTTSSTFIPSSAYLPSKSQFSGMSPQIGSLPRSAPSTPLGRQDARFLSSMRQNAPHQPLQPLQPSMFIDIPSPQPRATSHMGPQYSQSPVMQSYYTNNDYYDVTPGTPSTSGSNAFTHSVGPMSPGSPYIPYARPTKTPGSAGSLTTKRFSPYQSESLSSSKRTRQAEMSSLASSSPVKSESGARSVATSSPAGSTGDEKPKSPRCKIACSACRKTRLKCDGKKPCTSCVEKYMKSHPLHDQAQSQAIIEQEGSCLYENFVRRRGKGKKTIQKEQEEHIMRTSVGPGRSMSSEFEAWPRYSPLQMPTHANTLGNSAHMHYSE